MKKKRYIEPVCGVTQMKCERMILASSGPNAKAKSSLNVNDAAEEEYFYGETNRKGLFDDVW